MSESGSHHHTPHHHHEHERFSLPLFILTVAVTLAGISGILWFFFPEIWDAQIGASFWKYIAVFVAGSLFNGFIEYFFHRYVLHTPAVPWLSRLYRQHTRHHALTRITRKRTSDGHGILFIENKFPIIEPEQGEASFFPWYSLAIFAALITPILAGLSLLSPSFPWFFGGYLALASSLALYEIFHAINHWPFETWEPLIQHPRFGRFWRPVYAFHLRHHAVIDCNESISGFFGLPVADWVFGTCIIPQTLFADGESTSPVHFAPPHPIAPIRWLDAAAARAAARQRQRRARRVDAPVRNDELASVSRERT